MLKYTICFKNGHKITVYDQLVEDILDKYQSKGFLNPYINVDKYQYRLGINLDEIVYIQPEELEKRDNSFTFTPTDVLNSTGTQYITPQTTIQSTKI